MLRSLVDLLGYRLHADDGRLGRVRDFLFDDRAWTVRYLVLDTGRWLPGRLVLVSPSAAGYPDAETRTLRVGLTLEQLESSPSLARDRPMTRDEESRYVEHFGWPRYWELGTSWSGEELPPKPPPEWRQALGAPDPDLRSLRDFTRYSVRGPDGERVGELEDALADTDGWGVRALVVRCRPWLLGRSRPVALETRQVTRVDWHRRLLSVALDRRAVQALPRWEAGAPVNEDYRHRRFDHLGRLVETPGAGSDATAPGADAR